MDDLKKVRDLKVYNDLDFIKEDLSLNFKIVKEFLNYSDDFWNFMETRIKYLNNYLAVKDFYGVYPMFDSLDFLIDLKIIIPEIVNLKTSLINIHEFKHAYDLYNLLGCKIVNDDMFYEREAIKKEQQLLNIT